MPFCCFNDEVYFHPGWSRSVDGEYNQFLEYSCVIQDNVIVRHKSHYLQESINSRTSAQKFIIRWGMNDFLAKKADYGVTSLSGNQASPQRIFELNRGPLVH